MLDDSISTLPGQQFGASGARNVVDWRSCLPTNAGLVHDISDEAVWALSSCKVDGFGVHQLLDDRTDLFWQSDGPQPHTVTVEFQRKTDISFVLLYLDYKSDESYTPCKVQVQAGNSILDLEEPLTLTMNEPVGWQLLDLREDGRPVRAFVVVLQVLHNHQQGRDTHVRGMKVIGPSRPSLDINRRALAGNNAMVRHFNDPMFAKSTFGGHTVLR